MKKAVQRPKLCEDNGQNEVAFLNKKTDNNNNNKVNASL